MFSVALIGPDGAGKTTIGRRLEQSLPLPVKYLYMGVNHDASNRMLPTTRAVRWVRRILGVKKNAGGPRDPDAPRVPQRGLARRVVSSAKSSLSLINRLGEEWYRQAIAWGYQRRRQVVLFDRHYFSDFYAYDIAETELNRTINQRIHGFLLNHVYPKPDLTIYLDAPPEVLLARKGEGTLALLARRREDYLEMGKLVNHFEVVDANRPADQVARDVTERICQFYETRIGVRE